MSDKLRETFTILYNVCYLIFIVIMAIYSFRGDVDKVILFGVWAIIFRTFILEWSLDKIKNKP